jgi:hypothetical protein
MIFIGILGFVPGITEKDMFLGIFKVNAFLNFIHLITGLLAYFIGRLGINPSRLLFQTLGVIYAILGFLGFAHTSKHILRIIANNMADSWLHVAIALVCIFMGFFYKNR